jgi:hypothetical protein
VQCWHTSEQARQVSVCSSESFAGDQLRAFPAPRFLGYDPGVPEWKYSSYLIQYPGCPPPGHAIPLARLPVELEFVRDLEEFDGPLLSEFRSSKGDTFLYYWCDCNEKANRWLVVRAPRQDLFRYLVGRVTLRSLIRECRDRFLYVVDLDGDATVLSAWFVYAENIPENYLPRHDSVPQPGAGIEPGFQDVSIDQDWDYEQYPRKFLQAYSFHTAFGRGGNPKALDIDYRLTTGWIFDTLYRKIETNVPPAHRASLEAVSFASPGYLRFRVDPMIAEGLRNAVARYLDHRSELRRGIEELRSWTNRHEPDNDDDEAAMRRLIEQISGSLGIDGAALLSHIDTAKNAAKALSSYFARIEFLARNQVEQTAMLVGMPQVAR